MMMAEGVVASQAIEGVPDPEGKFKMYADYSEPAPRFRPIACWPSAAARRKASSPSRSSSNRESPSPGCGSNHARARRLGAASGTAIEDSYDRLLNPSIQTEIRLELKDRSDEEAIKVFRENLENLLLAPPAGRSTVLAIDPGIRTGCKIAVVDDTGKFLEDAVIYPHRAEARTGRLTKRCRA